jgi:FtsH-binding integral membrane protein
MDTVFDILTGAGLATAAGIRPFLPGLAAGAFAAADLTIDFDGTDLSFLEKPGFLLALVVALIVLVVLERRGESSVVENVLALIAVAVGAVLFAGALADHGDTWWPGIPAGALLAGLAFTASRNLFARVRARLDPEARGALPVYADGASLVLAVLAILVPPVSVVAIGFLVWLLLGSRRREGEKYAGLRILR